MKKTLLFLCAFTTLAAVAQFGVWDTLPFPYVSTSIATLEVDEASNTFLMAGGIFPSYQSTWDDNKLMLYKEGKIEPMPGNFGNKIWSAIRYHDTIIVGGVISRINGQPSSKLVYYDGSQWQNMAWFMTDGDSAAMIRRIRNIEDTLYVVGSFTEVDGQPATSIARRVGNQWEPFLPMALHDPGEVVSDIIKYKGKWYLAINGCRLHNGQTGCDIFVYENGAWIPAGGGLRGGLTGVDAMTIYKDELHIIGLILKSDGNVGNGIQRWNGQRWAEVGSGLQDIYGGYNYIVQPQELKVYGDKLYVSGFHMYSGNIPTHSISSWDGERWCGLNTNDIFSPNNLGISFAGFLNDTIFAAFHGDLIQNGHEIPYVGVLKAPVNMMPDTCSVDFSTSVEPIDPPRIEPLLIYPNPTQGIFFLESDEVVDRIQLLDITGRVLEQYTNVPQGTTEMDLSSYPNGVYLVKVTVGNKEVQQRVIQH